MTNTTPTPLIEQPPDRTRFFLLRRADGRMAYGISGMDENAVEDARAELADLLAAMHNIGRPVPA